MSASARRALVGWTALDLLALVYALVPVGWIVSLSLKPSSAIGDGRFVPRDVTLENYRQVFHTGGFTVALANSVAVALIATAVAVAAGALAAYAVARVEFQGKRVFVAVLLAVMMFPQISLATPLFDVERKLGLFDTWAGLVLPYATFAMPLAVYTLAAFFREIPRDLEDAASMDGASPMTTFRRVILPLAAPGAVATAILVFIFAWNDLLFASTLTATERSITAPVAMANFSGSSQFEEPTGTIAAAAVVITVPIVIFVVLFQRKIVAGLTSGAVKG
ncbi:binding-protein-dependent transport systems inner membrane component [Segniliparus rotundus DSM 44985]|uniref:Binding-protein-dependent transport systems inner membrane component n=1 Tax=Segniliparus rotundus (strain ATCC BAA-972 / CDC 1076 / CIP 108378 / DSM 44985 / JCM 13578) TaxID=640132 RepID=D6Z9A7_SEGRD|nr:carbohydrate ABC transporter permease [Segniliparus rotundus]ADG98537.1 binding-protein-dependent transport systems inner membrane component [Segniliparus rotundus DSM 44985]